MYIHTHTYIYILLLLLLLLLYILYYFIWQNYSYRKISTREARASAQKVKITQRNIKTLSVPIPQNVQTYSNNSPAKADKLFGCV